MSQFGVGPVTVKFQADTSELDRASERSLRRVGQIERQAASAMHARNERIIGAYVPRRLRSAGEVGVSRYAGDPYLLAGSLDAAVMASAAAAPSMGAPGRGWQRVESAAAGRYLTRRAGAMLGVGGVAGAAFSAPVLAPLAGLAAASSFATKSIQEYSRVNQRVADDLLRMSGAFQSVWQAAGRSLVNAGALDLATSAVKNTTRSASSLVTLAGWSAGGAARAVGGAARGLVSGGPGGLISGAVGGWRSGMAGGILGTGSLVSEEYRQRAASAEQAVAQEREQRAIALAGLSGRDDDLARLIRDASIRANMAEPNLAIRREKDATANAVYEATLAAKRDERDREAARRATEAVYGAVGAADAARRLAAGSVLGTLVGLAQRRYDTDPTPANRALLMQAYERQQRLGRDQAAAELFAKTSMVPGLAGMALLARGRMGLDAEMKAQMEMFGLGLDETPGQAVRRPGAVGPIGAGDSVMRAIFDGPRKTEDQVKDTNKKLDRVVRLLEDISRGLEGVGTLE